MEYFSHFVLFIFEWYFETLHSADHRVHRHVDVLIDKFDECSFVVVRVARAVNDAHLFNKRRLAGLARAQQE